MLRLDMRGALSAESRESRFVSDRVESPDCVSCVTDGSESAGSKKGRSETTAVVRTWSSSWNCTARVLKGDAGVVYTEGHTPLAWLSLSSCARTSGLCATIYVDTGAAAVSCDCSVVFCGCREGFGGGTSSAPVPEDGLLCKYDRLSDDALVLDHEIEIIVNRRSTYPKTWLVLFCSLVASSLAVDASPPAGSRYIDALRYVM